MSGESRDARHPSYRIMMMAKTGDVINSRRLEAENDEQVVECAKVIFDGHAMEVWDGLRLVWHFDAVD